jgi:hypothetical protein
MFAFALVAVSFSWQQRCYERRSLHDFLYKKIFFWDRGMFFENA